MPPKPTALQTLPCDEATFQREREEWHQKRQREVAAALPRSIMQDTMKLVQQPGVSALVDFREQLQRQGWGNPRADTGVDEAGAPQLPRKLIRGMMAAKLNF